MAALCQGNRAVWADSNPARVGRPHSLIRRSPSRSLKGQEIHPFNGGGGLMSSGQTNSGHLNLDQLQRAVFDVIRQPLTEDERMREQTLAGRSTHEIAETIVKPNDRLSSAERLEIYN